MKIDSNFISYLESEGYSNIKYINNRGICATMRFAFTTGLVYGIGQFGYVGRYCYSHNFDATKALSEWDGVGDPGDDQWIKHKGGKGEYRNPKRNEFHYD